MHREDLSIAEQMNIRCDALVANQADREEADAERERILAKARAEADAIVADAKNKPNDYDALIEAIVTEYEQRRSDNG